LVLNGWKKRIILAKLKMGKFYKEKEGGPAGRESPLGMGIRGGGGGIFSGRKVKRSGGGCFLKNRSFATIGRGTTDQILKDILEGGKMHVLRTVFLWGGGNNCLCKVRGGGISTKRKTGYKNGRFKQKFRKKTIEPKGKEEVGGSIEITGRHQERTSIS